LNLLAPTDHLTQIVLFVLEEKKRKRLRKRNKLETKHGQKARNTAFDVQANQAADKRREALAICASFRWPLSTQLTRAQQVL
jgi:hypothetical protein